MQDSLTIQRETLHLSMDQHARNIAVAFDIWKIDNGWTDAINGRWYHRNQTVDFIKTPDELYDMFLNSLRNDKGAGTTV